MVAKVVSILLLLLLIFSISTMAVKKKSNDWTWQACSRSCQQLVCQMKLVICAWVYWWKKVMPVVIGTWYASQLTSHIALNHESIHPWRLFHGIFFSHIVVWTTRSGLYRLLVGPSWRNTSGVLSCMEFSVQYMWLPVQYLEFPIWYMGCPTSSHPYSSITLS